MSAEPIYLWEVVYMNGRRELVEATHCYNGGGLWSGFGGSRPETHDFVKAGDGLVLSVRKDAVTEVRRLDIAPVLPAPKEPTP